MLARHPSASLPAACGLPTGDVSGHLGLSAMSVRPLLADTPWFPPTTNRSYEFDTTIKLHSCGKPAKSILSDTRTFTSWFVLMSLIH